MELAPLQERSWSGATHQNVEAGAESERDFLNKTRAGAERFMLEIELEWSRSDFLF